MKKFVNINRMGFGVFVCVGVCMRERERERRELKVALVGESEKM